MRDIIVDDQEALQNARDPSTSEAALEYLAVYSGPDVRRAIAVHPNTSLSSLLLLARERAEDVLKNPSFELRLVDSLPALRLRDHAGALSSLLAHPGLPASLRQALFDSIERRNERTLRSMTLDYIVSYGQFDEADAGLQSKILQHPEYPVERLESFLCGIIPEHRFAASRHPRAPRALIQSLIHLGSSIDLKRYTPENIKPVSSETLSRLARSGFWAQHLVARYPGAPPDILMMLSKSPIANIRGWVAMHEDVPSEALQALSRDINNTVIASIAANPRTPPEELTRLYSQNTLSSKVKQSLAENPNTPEPTLLSLTKMTDLFVGARLAARTHLPENVLLSLLNGTPRGEYSLFQKIAESPSVTEKVAEQLVKSKSVEVRRALASNPRCPPKALLSMCRDRDFDVRCMVVQNWNTPPEALRSLAINKSEEIRDFARSHPNNQPIAVWVERALSLGRALHNELQEKGIEVDSLAQRALMTFEAIAPQLASAPNASEVLSSLRESLWPQRKHPLTEYLCLLADVLSRPLDGLPLSSFRAISVSAFIFAGASSEEASDRAKQHLESSST